MFKIICLFAIVAVASVAAKADPKPGVIAYSSPVVAAAAPAFVAPAATATFYEQTFHGNFAPAAYSTPYLSAPLAYSAYEPFVAAAPAPFLFK